MSEEINEDTRPHTATYSPEDDKIRVYLAYRVEREEWLILKNAGFKWTKHQDSDAVAKWTPAREDAALQFAPMIEDEDQPRAERAAQRAERFAQYGEKRLSEATGYADTYESGPQVHGYQNERRAERAAARHDRIGSKAVDQWRKAEYWSQRTAGVIANALYLERADVRHRRIKGLESDIARYKADMEPSEVIHGVEAVRRYRGQEYVDKGHDTVGIFGQGRGKYAHSYNAEKGIQLGERAVRMYEHLQLRHAYEVQMLEAVGGTMADAIEMVEGGFIGDHQILKLTKDRAGRVNKVTLKNFRFKGVWAYKAEDLPDEYRAPTAEEAAAFAAIKEAAKAAKPKRPPLINLSLEDAQKLQQSLIEQDKERLARLNKSGRWPENYFNDLIAQAEDVKVEEMEQKRYSILSKGTYARYETLAITADWKISDKFENTAFLVRSTTGRGLGIYVNGHIVVAITDKKTKPLPAYVAPSQTEEVAHETVQ